MPASIGFQIPGIMLELWMQLEGGEEGVASCGFGCYVAYLKLGRKLVG